MKLFRSLQDRIFKELGVPVNAQILLPHSSATSEKFSDAEIRRGVKLYPWETNLLSIAKELGDIIGEVAPGGLTEVKTQLNEILTLVG